MHASALALLPLAATLAFGACSGGERPTLSDAPAPTIAATTSTPTVMPDAVGSTTAPTTDPSISLDARGVVGRVTGSIDVFDVPGGNVVRTMAATTEFGSATTLAGIEWSDPQRSWLKVHVPTRPNGMTGYVRADDVELGRTDLRIDVDLAARRIVVRDGTEIVIDAAVAVGAAATPTPTGSFFVTDVVDNPNDAGAYGPFALGLSAHSEVLDQFGGGDGQIGIHGTDQPGSIGDAVSHGCVRVPNDVVAHLAGIIPLGTPVSIR
jgi:lipoprotein-anchoring transpeptidase ErfK/SrfK